MRAKGLVLGMLDEAIATLEKAVVVLSSSDYILYTRMYDSTTYRSRLSSSQVWYILEVVFNRDSGNLRQASAMSEFLYLTPHLPPYPPSNVSKRRRRAIWLRSPERRESTFLHSVSTGVIHTSRSPSRDARGVAHPGDGAGMPSTNATTPRDGGATGHPGVRGGAGKTVSVSPQRKTNGVGAGAGGQSRGQVGFEGDDDPDEALVPEETFLDSLHLDRDQMSDFCNSEGHFLYLRQKPGADATAYNLEVIFDGSIHTEVRLKTETYKTYAG